MRLYPMTFATATLAALASCSAFTEAEGPEVSPAPNDAAPTEAATAESGPSDAAPGDQSSDASLLPRCDTSKPFEDLVPVPGLTQANFFSMHASPDELNAFVTLNQGMLLYTRATKSVPFVPAAVNIFATLNQGLTEQYPRVSDDGRTLVFSRSTEIWRSDRADAGASFGASARLVLAGAFEPYLLPDASAIYFRRNLAFHRLGADGGEQLAYTQQFSETATAPVVSADELTLYFASNRGDGGVPQSTTIWKVRRSSDAPFSAAAAVPVTELRSSFGDEPMWLSADECTIYFRSGRSGVGLFEIYVARKQL